MSLKRGIDQKKGKKIPLITDGRVKAFIGKALTGRLNEESFTYYYNMFRSTLIYHETLMVFCYCLFSAFFLISVFRRMGDCMIVRDGPLGNLWGGGGAGEVQKKNSRKGKFNLKEILARQLTLRNIHARA